MRQKRNWPRGRKEGPAEPALPNLIPNVRLKIPTQRISHCTGKIISIVLKSFIVGPVPLLGERDKSPFPPKKTSNSLHRAAGYSSCHFGAAVPREPVKDKIGLPSINVPMARPGLHSAKDSPLSLVMSQPLLLSLFV